MTPGSLGNPFISHWIHTSISALRATESAVADSALSIRRGVQTIDEDYYRRMSASLLAVRDLRRIVLSRPSNLGIPRAVAVSSWKDQGFYDLY